MERLTRPCEDTENGKYLPYTAGTYNGIFPDCTLGKVIERLAYYENLEEQDRLLILQIEKMHPCINCGTGWGEISSSGCKSCHDTCERLKEYNRTFGGITK